MLTSLFVLASLAVEAHPASSRLCSIRELRESPGYRWRVDRIARSAGQRGDCFAREYRLGADYLLLLQDRHHPQLNSIEWWPLGPVNEQLHGDDDPWLVWVRDRVAQRTSGGDNS